MFGFDTTTPEGREQFKKEFDTLRQMFPELLAKEDLQFPHEIQDVNTEPHFRRIWQHYREHMFRVRLAYFVEEGEVSAADADAFRRFISLTGTPSLTTYLYARLGQLPNIESSTDY